MPIVKLNRRKLNLIHTVNPQYCVFIYTMTAFITAFYTENNIALSLARIIINVDSGNIDVCPNKLESNLASISYRYY